MPAVCCLSPAPLPVAFCLIRSYNGQNMLLPVICIFCAVCAGLFLSGERRLKYALVFPSTFVLAAVTLVPSVYLFYLSVHDVSILNFNKKWVFTGLRNFINLLFHSPDNLAHPFVRTLEYLVFTVSLEFLLGLALALLFSRAFPLKNIFTALFMIPMMLPPIVVGLMWKAMLNMDNGLVNQLLAKAHLEPVPWLTDTALPFVQSIPFAGKFLVEQLNFNLGFFVILFLDVWQWTPFMFLVLSAGIYALPQEPFEAARIDGAGFWQTLRHITLPLLRPVILVAVLIRTMDAMKAYDTIWALFGNSSLVRTINISVYNLGMDQFEHSRGAALSVLLLFFITFLCSFLIRALSSSQQ